MLKIGVVGFGTRASDLLGGLNDFGEEYEVNIIYDIDPERSRYLALSRDHVKLAGKCIFCRDLTEFATEAAKLNLNGIMIANFCNLHTPTACKLEPLGVPLFLEKPIAVNMQQLQSLYDCFNKSETPVQVSFPMRLTPVAKAAKQIIDSGRLGRITQVAAYNDVSYGDVYYSCWFRDYEHTGGMFMQKAVHDIDCICYLLNSNPVQICAMNSRSVFGGDKPVDLKCCDCNEQKNCPESPFSYFYRRGAFNTVEAAYHRSRGDCMCRFSKAVSIEDIGECIMEFTNGVQMIYHQNFFARNQAHRRGARYYGYEGTMQIDFPESEIKIYSHMDPRVEKIAIDVGKISHGGGDLELLYDFIQMMKERKTSRTDLIHGDCIPHAQACLLARESAQHRTFQQMTAL